MHKLRIGYGTLFLCLLLALSGCKSKGEPAAFWVDNESFGSLNTLLEEQVASFVSSSAPSKKEIKAHAKDENAQPLMYTFVYADLAESGITVERYMKKLIAVAQGFMIIDENGVRDRLPDFTAESGNLVLRRTNLDTFVDICLQFDWTGSDLTIRAWQQEANSTFAIFKPKEDSAAADEETDAAKTDTEGAQDGADNATAPAAASSTTLSASGALDFVKGLSPAVLGLPGTSMQAYNVYYTDGKAEVDGKPCVRLRVYETGASSGTNTFLGTFLLASDSSALYRLASKDGPPIALPLP